MLFKKTLLSSELIFHSPNHFSTSAWVSPSTSRLSFDEATRRRVSYTGNLSGDRRGVALKRFDNLTMQWISVMFTVIR